MTIISKTELKYLAEVREALSISIYLPTHRAGPEVQQDPIRLKNQLSEAATSLEKAGLAEEEVEVLLAPAYELLKNTLFWQYQSDGLAIFLNADMFRFYRLPFQFDPLTVVTERFHLKPLLPIMSGDGRFYVLTLSQEEVRLVQGTHYSVSEVDIQGIPEGLPAILREDWEPHVQFHSRTSRTHAQGGAVRPAVFHGQGAEEADEKADILRYFRQVDAGIQALLHEQQAPLILVGVAPLQSLYHEANTYPYLLEEGIDQHPESLDMPTLHQRAWSIVEPYFVADRQEALALYHELQGAGGQHTEISVEQVVRSAYYARIATLFIVPDAPQWGTFDPQSGDVTIHDPAQPRDEDLVDFAAVHTLLNGGQVYMLSSDKFPDAPPVAAILRF